MGWKRWNRQAEIDHKRVQERPSHSGQQVASMKVLMARRMAEDWEGDVEGPEKDDRITFASP
jgi:hypothetical protein